MAELTIPSSSADSPVGARRLKVDGLAPGLHLVSRNEPERARTDMRTIDAVVSDLEWKRLRRRFNMNPAEALLLNCGTWAVIAVLKLVAR
jgi:hypothetical protein